MLKVAERWFERRVMGEGVTWIWEPHLNPFIRCNIWYVRGRSRDLIVDTGSGLSPLRRAIADLIARPLAAVATHIHYDHVGGLYEFESG
jgi:glyoxylase-like metal-dependent hydrolase (beta-lactamase superfamily II)